MSPFQKTNRKRRAPSFLTGKLLAGAFLVLVFAVGKAKGEAVETVEGAAGMVAEKRVFIARTADGLPVEAEFIGLWGDVLRARLTSSGREMALSLSKQKDAVRERLTASADEIRKKVVALPFKVAILENTSTKSGKRFPQRGRLHLKNAETVRLLLPGARCLRIRVPVRSETDIPVEAHIYWYARAGDTGAWSMEFYEKAELGMGENPEDEYLSQPPKFPRPAYQGYAVVIFNSVNKALLWKGASGSAFLQDAERRLGLLKPKTLPAVKAPDKQQKATS
jgi:hypothetical protein